jgi:hypothetical protein
MAKVAIVAYLFSEPAKYITGRRFFSELRDKIDEENHVRKVN